MGCHTWFGKNVEVSYEEVKRFAINIYERDIEFNNSIIDGTVKRDVLELFPELTKEFGIKHKAIAERKLRMIKSDHCKLAMYNRYEHITGLTFYANGEFYVYTHDLPHDLFRVGNYPEDKLFSLDETLDFIEANANDVYKQDEELLSKLANFWVNNPNGIILFG